VNCSDVQTRLSAYHDSELLEDEAAQVAAHLAHCSSCAAELASFEQLSGLSRKLTDPPIPAHMWEDLQAQLRGGKEDTQILGWINSKGDSGRLLALAVTILIAVGIGVIAYRSRFTVGGHDHLAGTFDSFLDEFENQPDDAQQVLLVNYDGRPTTLQEAVNVLGYEPVAAKRLPPGCSIDKVYLLKMPCCTCAQITCRNESGHHLAIFEHDLDQPVWFGDRPSVSCLCHDVPTSVVQVGNKLAATWKEGKRFITIIGANNLEEVTDLVAHLSGQ